MGSSAGADSLGRTRGQSCSRREGGEKSGRVPLTMGSVWGLEVLQKPACGSWELGALPEQTSQQGQTQGQARKLTTLPIVLENRMDTDDAQRMEKGQAAPLCPRFLGKASNPGPAQGRVNIDERELNTRTREEMTEFLPKMALSPSHPHPLICESDSHSPGFPVSNM